ncbi:MAG: DUF2829 domain-containing protein [Gammaproteobacteria bacterium]|nr:DUF2829 domain-containing protein [Gammaproteobacteria bacterium]
MLITGVQGEIYPCKLDIFKATYTPVGAHLDIAKHEDHDFSWALVQIKQGSNVARQGWNGKGMFVFLVPGSTFKVNRPPLMGIYPEGTEVNYQAHIDMKTADGSVVPWLASQSDLLAEDWVVVG